MLKKKPMPRIGFFVSGDAETPHLAHRQDHAFRMSARVQGPRTTKVNLSARAGL
jgi:hypothetical protein